MEEGFGTPAVAVLPVGILAEEGAQSWDRS